MRERRMRHWFPLMLLAVSVCLIGCGQSRSVSTPEWTENYQVEEKGDGDLRIVQMTDPHYYSRRLTDFGTLYQQVMAAPGGRDAAHVEEILQAFYKKLSKDKPDVLIVSGDLSLNGEKQSHEDFADYLAKFKAIGIQVLVIPGNHDINSTGARSITDEGVTYVDAVTPEEFREIYYDCGYKEAIDEDEDSLSYVIDLNDQWRVIMVDSCIYKTRTQNRGYLTKNTKDWILQVVDEAHKVGKEIFTVTHQNMLVHSEVFEDGYVISNCETLINSLIEKDVILNLSGHMHTMNIADKNKQFYDIALESLTVWPNLYGQLDLRQNGDMSYITHRVQHSHDSYPSLWASCYDKQDARLEGKDLTEEEKELLKQYLSKCNALYFAGRVNEIQATKDSREYELLKKTSQSHFMSAFIMSLFDSDRPDSTYISVEEFARARKR